jgi:hypothetical protein
LIAGGGGYWKGEKGEGGVKMGSWWRVYVVVLQWWLVC